MWNTGEKNDKIVNYNFVRDERKKFCWKLKKKSWPELWNSQCTIGRGGVKTKWRQDACYWLWKLCVKILAAMKKDPSQFRKCPEQCFLRPDLNFFLEFQKKNLFTIFVTLKMTIKKYFFQKKTCQKNLPTKFVEKICQLKMASGCMLLTMKSRCRNTFFNEKRPELVQEMSGTMIF